MSQQNFMRPGRHSAYNFHNAVYNFVPFILGPTTVTWVRRDSSVGIATGLGRDGSDFIPCST
jgi:hypothetical protein